MEPEEPVKTSPSVATRLSGLFSSAHDLEARGGDSRTVHKSSTVVLRLKDLPPNVAEALASLDVDGDGTIDVGELHHGAKETERTVSKSKFYRKMLIILLGVCLAQLASFCGVMVGSINLTKESHVYDGRMTTRDGLSVVQTAQATSSLPLASTLSDDAFLELKTVGLTSPRCDDPPHRAGLRAHAWSVRHRDAYHTHRPHRAGRHLSVLHRRHTAGYL